MTEETQEIAKYPVMEKQMHAVGIGFKVLKKEPRSMWITNYAYYLKQKKDGGPLKPLYGRMNEKQFQVYEDGNWENKDLWKDFSEPVLDKEGNGVNNANGKPKHTLLFDNKMELLVKFENPSAIQYWDKDESAVVTKEHEVAWVRMSKNLFEKVSKEFSHKRADPEDNYVIEFDDTKSPAEMYSVTIKE